MRISRIRIQNFRSFSDETIYLNHYNCLVGSNGSGKSTILCALNIFFRDTFHSSSDNTVLSEEDFHCKNTAEPVRITVTFTDLTPETQEEFSHYFRLGELSITSEAKFDPATKLATVKQYGERKGIARFADFFSGETSLKASKEKYEVLKAQFLDLPAATTKPAMTEALQAYEAEHEDLCELIQSSDEFYGFTKGANKLEKYVLWVYVPAVKDASSEQLEAKNTAFGRLLALTVRASVNFDESLKFIKQEAQQKYQGLLDSHQQHLDQLSGSLQTRLQQWSHPDVRLQLKWRNDAEKSLKVESPLAESVAGEGVFDGALSRFGHGLQRSYLLALLQELAATNTEQNPKLILGCEEPELYQHPPQARHLAQVFVQLTQNNSQVIVSTHTPYFVSGKEFEDVRYVRRSSQTNQSKIAFMSHELLSQRLSEARGESPSSREGIIAKIHQALQPHISEMFFAPVIILVEGLEDVAHITTYLHLLDLWEDFRRYGCHFIPANNKSNLFNPIIIANEFKIPYFVIFDGDANAPEENGRREKHRKDNLTILNLCNVQSPEPFPPDDYWADNLVMWNKNITDRVKSDFQGVDYERIKSSTLLSFDDEGNLHKNSLFIAELLNNLWLDGKRSENLERLCRAIITFAKNTHTSAVAATASTDEC